MYPYPNISSNSHALKFIKYNKGCDIKSKAFLRSIKAFDSILHSLLINFNTWELRQIYGYGYKTIYQTEGKPLLKTCSKFAVCSFLLYIIHLIWVKASSILGSFGQVTSIVGNNFKFNHCIRSIIRDIQHSKLTYFVFTFVNYIICICYIYVCICICICMYMYVYVYVWRIFLKGFSFS